LRLYRGDRAILNLKLEQPFSLPAALKFGLIFLSLHVAGTLAQRGRLANPGLHDRKASRSRPEVGPFESNQVVVIVIAE
jgi:hypothetical protein